MTASAAQPRSSRLLATIGITAMVASALPPFMTASLAVEIRGDLGLSNSALGVAVAVSYAVATLLSSAAGRVVDRIGPARGIYLGASLGLACSLIVAVVVQSTAMLIAALTLAGLANAVSAPGASALISHGVTPRRQGVTFGIQHAGAPMSALLGGLALSLIALPLGWRWAFAVSALMPIAVIVMMRALRGSGADSAPRPARVRLGRRPVHLIAVSAALANVAANGMVAFLVVYVVEEGLSKGSAGALLAVTSVVAGVARIAGGAFADARGGNALRSVVVLLLLGAIGYPLLATGQPVALVAGAILAGGIGWGWSGLMTLAIVQTNRDLPGAAVGVGMMGIYAGAGIGPVVVGVLAQAASFTVAWMAAAGFAVLAAVLVAVADRLQKRTTVSELANSASA